VITLAFLIGLAAVAPAHSVADAPERRAQQLFAHFVQLAHAFDPALADLYADEARIVSVRQYPSGPDRTFELRGTEYKALIREAMPLAKARGDLNTYANLSYQREGARVWIRATRHSVLKQYSSPYSRLVGPDGAGKWLIYEERSITRP
jgi:hypothetical protein